MPEGDSAITVPSLRDLKRFGAGITIFLMEVGAIYVAGWFLKLLFGGS